MTRRLERRLEQLEAKSDADDTRPITLRETTVGSEWSGSDLEPGETETTVTVIDL